ncbi:MAG: MFS transporter [Bacilli bacterium]
MENVQQKKSLFKSPILSTKIKSPNAKVFPEGVLGYFVGPTLALLANSILSGYLNTYFTNVLNMTAWASTFLTLLPVISVIFVVIGNILVGRLMDHSKTKAGKARPLLLLSLPLSILALLILFVFSPLVSDASDPGQQMLALCLIAVGYNLWFAFAYPCYYTSHAALINLSTRNSKDRSLLATISNATALAAMGLCSMVLPFFLGLLFVNTGTESNPVYDVSASYNHWKIFVIALVVITFIGVVIEYYFTRERVTEESFGLSKSNDTVKKAAPISKQFKVCIKDKFWVIIIFFFFLYQLGGMLKNVSQLYFCQAMFQNSQGGYDISTGGVYQGTLSIIGAIPTALGMLIAWPLANKIGKGKAIFFGAAISVVGGVIGLINPTSFPIVVVSFIVKALGSTPAMYLSMALLADILDHQEALHGFRTDGLTMTIYGAIMAGMTGIATGIMNGILGGVGYSLTNVSSETIRAVMPWLFIGGETICYGIIFILFIFMGVEKFSKFDHKAIILNQKAEAEAEGREYVDPQTRMELEEKESDAQIEKARVESLKATCAKKGLDFEAEEAKYQKVLADKKASEEAKKAQAKQKEADKKAAEKAKYDALSAEEKAAVEAKKAEAEKREAERTAAALAEFNELRKANNRPVIE